MPIFLEIVKIIILSFKSVSNCEAYIATNAGNRGRYTGKSLLSVKLFQRVREKTGVTCKYLQVVYDTIANKMHNIAMYNFTIKTLILHVSILQESSSGRKHK
jgi:hypothetical protein